MYTLCRASSPFLCSKYTGRYPGDSGKISNYKDKTIAALGCAIPWHPLIQSWKPIILLDAEFIVDSGLNVWKDLPIFSSDCVCLGFCL